MHQHDLISHGVIVVYAPLPLPLPPPPREGKEGHTRKHYLQEPVRLNEIQIERHPEYMPKRP